MAWSAKVELVAPTGAKPQPVLPPWGSWVAGGSIERPPSLPGEELPLEPPLEPVAAPLPAEPLLASIPEAAIAPEPATLEPLSVAPSPLAWPPDPPTAPLA
jgi:hypothetical protein